MSQAGKLSFGGARSGFTKYMVPELLQDLAGNNVTHTVFLECHSFYDESAPAHLQPVGETRQCQAFADEQRTVAPHSTQVCAGIVSKVDLTLGRERVEESLDAHARCANFR
jgi:L-fuconolactonase|eukprot:COSAG01_NODE_102_length_26290_cov_94.760299_23_plen_111_part_00